MVYARMNVSKGPAPEETPFRLAKANMAADVLHNRGMLAAAKVRDNYPTNGQQYFPVALGENSSEYLVSVKALAGMNYVRGMEELPYSRDSRTVVLRPGDIEAGKAKGITVIETSQDLEAIMKPLVAGLNKP